MTATSLKKDPAPATTPTPAVEIRTDMWNDIVDIINGVSAEQPNFVQQFATKTGSYTATIDDFAIMADATSAAFTVTLPSAAATGAVQKLLAIKKTDASSNKVTIDGNAAETIDGKTTIDLETENEVLIIQSDGTNWVIVASYLAVIDNGLLKIRNPAGTFAIAIKTSADVANRSATIPLLGADDTFVMVNLAQNLRAKNLYDSNGNEILLTVGVGSAVNHLQITNSTTGNDPILEAVGDDTNIGISILPKGTGKVKLGSTDLQGNDADNIKKLIHDLETITSSTAITVNFDNEDLAKLALAHDTTFSSSNLAVGKTKEIHITSASAQALDFPAGWTFYGTKPTTTSAGKDSVLQLTSIGSTDADVKAVFVEEE